MDRRIRLGLIACALASCGHTPARLQLAPAAPVDTPQDVSWWEAQARPDRIMLLSYVLAGAASAPNTPGAHVRKPREGSYVVRLRRWTQKNWRIDGVVRLTPNTFSLSVDIEDSEPSADEPRWWSVQMEGRRDDDGLWYAEGDLAAQGRGRVQVSAARLSFSKLCPSEPTEGTLRLRSSGREAVVSYDGETDCSDDGVATWALDGEPQGEVDVARGLRCSVGRASGFPRGAAVLLLLLALGRPARSKRREPGQP